MLTSMTGFGRSSCDASFGKLTIEIQSVNRKYLDVFISLPKEFGRLEFNVRKWIGEKIVRGQVSVRAYFIPNASAAAELLPDLNLLLGLKSRWEHLAANLGYDSKQIDLHFLMTHSPIQQTSSYAEDAALATFEECCQEALKQLLVMKAVEGKALALDIEKRVCLLEKYLGEIEALSFDAVKRMRDKLIEKMKEVLESGPELDERLLKEAVLLAERVDITEEIVRVRSHFGQLRDLLHPKKDMAVGRKMDFLIQEIGREINTIGSKSVDANIVHRVVEMKSELEKIREQAQNIE